MLPYPRARCFRGAACADAGLLGLATFWKMSSPSAPFFIKDEINGGRSLVFYKKTLAVPEFAERKLWALGLTHCDTWPSEPGSAPKTPSIVLTANKGDANWVRVTGAAGELIQSGTTIKSICPTARRPHPIGGDGHESRPQIASRTDLNSARTVSHSKARGSFSSR